MRKNLERNEHGQLCGMTPISKAAEEMATEYFKQFPEVDFQDLLVILIKSASFASSMLMLKEVNERNEGK